MLSEFLPRGQKALGLRRLAARLLAALCLIALCINFCPKSGAQMAGLTVEQVRANMPQLYVYCSGADASELKDMEVSAYLDGKPLEYAETRDGGQDGVDYIFLLDISGSVKEADFEAAKEQILKFYKNLGKKDTLALVAFGDDVKTVFNGAAGSSKFESELMALEAGDAQTHLYEAIYSGVAYAQAQDVSRRQIMLVVSDGIQDTGSVDITQVDVERALEQASLPLYSVCAQSAPRSEQEKLSTFAHQTGGEFYVYDSDSAQQVWQQLADKLDDCGVLVFESDSNRVDGKSHTLLLKYRNGDGAQSSITRQVVLAQWQPDNTAPCVEGIDYSSAFGEITLTFSENVDGANSPDAYRFVSGSKSYTAASVAAKGENTYIVALPQELPSGVFLLEIAGVTDSSMEKNELEYEPVGFKKPVDMRRLLLWGAAAAGALLVIVLAAVLLRRKKPEEQVVRYCVEHIKPPEPPQSMAGGHERENTAQLTIGLVSGSRVEQTRTIRFGSSSIWGRGAEMCDLCIADKKISHQHCVLELDKDEVVIRDLDSRNGTYLNGVRITQPSRIKQGDSIRLGDTTIRVLALAVDFCEPGGQEDRTAPI